MSCDVGKTAEGLENELKRRWSDGKVGEWATFQSLHLRHSSFSNPSVALPTSQLILQPFRCFTYATAHSATLLSLLLCHKLFTCVTWRAAHDFHMLNVFDSFSKKPSTDKAMNLNLAYSGLLQGHLTCYSLKFSSKRSFYFLLQNLV